MTVRVIAAICAVALLAAAGSARADLLGYEDFMSYNVAPQEDRITAPLGQNPPAAGTGFSSWTASNPWGSYRVVEESAAYSGLVTSGRGLLVDSGGLQFDGMLDVAGALAPVSDVDSVGKDGTTLYISFGFQLKDALTNNTQNQVRLRNTLTSSNRLSMGQNWNATVFNTTGNAPIDVQPHLYVIKIVYGEANADAWSVIFDPDLTLAEGDQTVDASGSKDMTITAFNMQSQANDGFLISDIRFGTTFADVTPVPEPASLTVLALAGLGLLRRRR